MSVYPAALWRPVNYTGLHARQRRAAMLLHTNGGGAALFGWWSQIAASGQHIGAQYQVMWNGQVECYVDPDYVVYHAYDASEWAFGVETQDDGDNSRPWTPQQVASIAAIGRFHGVPPVRLGSANPGDGVGTHQDHIEWNHDSHDCAGSTRAAQVSQVLALMGNGAGPVFHPTPAPAGLTVDGNWGDATTRALQAALHVMVDGSYGPATKMALQRHLNVPADGVVGPFTIKALQRHVLVPADGVLGAMTIAALQRALNAHRF